jgi:hypothetical protein
MLLFLLRDNFRELPESPRAAHRVPEFCPDARAVLGAGLFLSAWCALRLLADPGVGLSVDVVLAVACLCLGIVAALHGARTLRP